MGIKFHGHQVPLGSMNNKLWPITGSLSRSPTLIETFGRQTSLQSLYRRCSCQPWWGSLNSASVLAACSFAGTLRRCGFQLPAQPQYLHPVHISAAERAFRLRFVVAKRKSFLSLLDCPSAPSHVTAQNKCTETAFEGSAGLSTCGWIRRGLLSVLLVC